MYKNIQLEESHRTLLANHDQLFFFAANHVFYCVQSKGYIKQREIYSLYKRNWTADHKPLSVDCPNSNLVKSTGESHYYPVTPNKNWAT